MYNRNNRNSYQDGGMPSREELFTALSERGALGDMSFEEFSQIPPDQINQILQSMQQEMRYGGRSNYQESGMTDEEMVRRSNAPIADSAMSGPRTPAVPAVTSPRTATGGNEQSNLTGNKKPFNYKEAMESDTGAAVGTLAGIGLSHLGEEGSKTSARNTVSRAGSNFVTGTQQGGPLMGAAMVIGDEIGTRIGAEQDRKNQYALSDANNSGTLGTSLNPMVARDGSYVPSSAERYAVARTRGTTNNPSTIGTRNSFRGNVGSNGIGRAGYQGSEGYFNDRQYSRQDGGQVYDTPYYQHGGSYPGKKFFRR